MMNRLEAENYIYSSYMRAEPYQNRTAPDSVLRHPELTRQIIRDLSDPHNSTCILVTGSKGKGSVAEMIACLLSLRYTTGLMTGPHLIRFNERFKVNGKEISDEDFSRLMSCVRDRLDPIERTLPENVCISPMGVQTILALMYFQEMRTRFNILECGKGAKYDDVNNTIHDYAVINSIFPEHMRELGGSLESIASDKSHVITQDLRCVWLGPQEARVKDILLKRAEHYKVPVKMYGRDYFADRIRCDRRGTVFDARIGNELIADIRIPLLGEFQARNCVLALALCKDLLERLSGNERSDHAGDLSRPKISVSSIIPDYRRSLGRLRRPGRMEILSEDPFILLDACIHAQSAKEVLHILGRIGIKKPVVIIGIPDDKDYLGTAEIMKSAASSVILTKSQNPHYIFTDIQRQVLEERGIRVTRTESLREAIEKASTDPAIVILGTTSLISEAEKMFKTI